MSYCLIPEELLSTPTSSILRLTARDALFQPTIADAKAEIAHYESLIKGLRTKIKAAQLQLDSAAFPILTLPLEITTQLFLWCLPSRSSDNDDDKWNRLLTDRAPLSLSYVCRDWREIALSTPALWSNIEVEMDSIGGADLFEAWMERVKGPLSVKLSGFAEHGWDEHLTDILQVLDDHAGEIQLLELEYINHEALQEFASAVSAWKFQSLQKLTVGLDIEGIPTMHIKAFAKAPLLREVSLTETPFSLFTLPWPQLTKITGSFAKKNCLKILRSAPSLLECAFTAWGKDGGGRKPAVFTHSKLQSLTFLGDSDTTAWGTNFLQLLTLPALESLSILDCKNADFDDDAFYTFLSRSSPPLRKLAIRLADGTGLDKKSLLLMPGLVDLELWQVRKTLVTLVFDGFGSDASLFPKLQHFALLGCRAGRKLEPPVFQLLETVAPGLTARWEVRQSGELAELKTFRITWDCGLGDLGKEAVLLPFKKLAQEGMNIRLEDTERVHVKFEVPRRAAKRPPAKKFPPAKKLPVRPVPKSESESEDSVSDDLDSDGTGES
ncbi:hypothetical protein C8F04DRAFT_1317793 [Mycena alexandri]|uniref:F-box domain-containing protein n=1 Tax=Mycena alexandri TaxID=1745969 RepID=A0AAD6X7M2_9AGAR|nr:hypothetical protein C8F04DRAFT_1317793 [Mycena alexandri]